MNAKLCKELRRRAKKLTAGMPERALVRVGTSFVNAKKTTRGTYRYMKRMDPILKRFHAPRNNHG
jgi:hypothetical protein